jgi:hypothetical protein
LILPFTKITSVFKENVFGVFQDWIVCHFRFTNFINCLIYTFGNMKFSSTPSINAGDISQEI